MSDLGWMNSHGLDRAVLQHAKAGLVIGICGGMQMLGQQIEDPDGIEQQGCMPGLGLLPIITSMQADKVTRVRTGGVRGGLLFGQQFRDNRVAGYEIHVGKTCYSEFAEPFSILDGGEPDGCLSRDGRAFGTYLHGIFDGDSFRHQFLNAARSFCGLASPRALNPWKAQREESFERLSREVSKALDMESLFSWVGLKYE
jgi:adenosylcobyric acid synthase